MLSRRYLGTPYLFPGGRSELPQQQLRLVVNQGGTNAQFKGSGTINGEDDYKFMLWAGDDEPDTFRIRIWTEEVDFEIVEYDNGSDQAIGGGSIIVHTGKK